jgi:ABC-type glucose/galactose transport system permease subunit
MVFFDSKANEMGQESLVIGKQWCLFPVITFPLTILIFVVWVLWQRCRYRSHSDTLGISIGRNMDVEMVGKRVLWLSKRLDCD